MKDVYSHTYHLKCYIIISNALLFSTLFHGSEGVREFQHVIFQHNHLPERYLKKNQAVLTFYGLYNVKIFSGRLPGSPLPAQHQGA